MPRLHGVQQNRIAQTFNEGLHNLEKMKETWAPQAERVTWLCMSSLLMCCSVLFHASCSYSHLMRLFKLMWMCAVIFLKWAYVCTQVKPDCSNFDESQAWPLLLDNYVEHVQKQQGQVS